MHAALVFWLLCAPADAAVDTVVVCPAEFREALAPWLDHRRGQGHRVALVSNRQSSEEIRAEVRQIAARAPLEYLVLVGDADPAMARDAGLRARSVPTHHAPAVVIRQFGSEPEIATDNWYADLNDDRVPDLAVGRLPADSAAELRVMVQKILAYEASSDFGRWRSRVHFVAGLGGFGTLVDAALEAAARSLIGQGVPPGYDVTMTYASWQSPYCPDPRQFCRVTVERLNEGSLFWVYMGHGDVNTVDFLRVPGAVYPILTSRDVPLLACRRGAPIACFLSCYSGAFDQPRDCLAEEMLRQPGGPVAVVCGSRVTMPYAMSVMGSELLHECFVARHETLGQLLTSAKRRTMQTGKLEGQRAAIESAAKAMSPTSGDLAAERGEHLELFNLLGDPLMRLTFPQEATLDVAPQATAGEQVSFEGASPIDGLCTVELVVRRGRPSGAAPRRAPFDPRAMDDYTEVYRRANEPRLATTAVQAHDGHFSGKLMVPPSARGPCHLRAFVEGAAGCAVGVADVRVDGPR